MLVYLDYSKGKFLMNKTLCLFPQRKIGIYQDADNFAAMLVNCEETAESCTLVSQFSDPV